MPLPPLLYEDAALLAFDKPSGLAVARDRRERARGPTLMEAVQAAYGAGVANVHRLDTAASGVLLCARTKAALDFLSGQFQAKTVARQHLALVVVRAPERIAAAPAAVRAASGGLPEAFRVDLALGEDTAHPGRVCVLRKGGKPSATEFRLLGAFGRFAWLECRPLTGRVHQIRVHLAAAGAPVLNDALYGDPADQLLLSGLKRRYKGREAERPLIARLALHAAELTILHPETRAPLVLAAPLPHDFAVALKYLRRYAAPGGANR